MSRLFLAVVLGLVGGFSTAAPIPKQPPTPSADQQEVIDALDEARRSLNEIGSELATVDEETGKAKGYFEYRTKRLAKLKSLLGVIDKTNDVTKGSDEIRKEIKAALTKAKTAVSDLKTGLADIESKDERFETSRSLGRKFFAADPFSALDKAIGRKPPAVTVEKDD